MPDDKKPSKIRQLGNISLLTLIIGALLLYLFHLAYPNTPVSEVVFVATIVAFIIALAVDKLLARLKSRRTPDV